MLFSDRQVKNTVVLSLPFPGRFEWQHRYSEFKKASCFSGRLFAAICLVCLISIICCISDSIVFRADVIASKGKAADYYIRYRSVSSAVSAYLKNRSELLWEIGIILRTALEQWLMSKILLHPRCQDVCDILNIPFATRIKNCALLED